MSTLKLFEETLAKLTYKPGWTFDTYAGYLLQVNLKTINVHAPYEEVTVTATQNIPLLGVEDEQGVVKMVGKMIRELELHEVNEWFKFNGKVVEEPHP